MDKIIKATPLENYQIEILTSSGISGIFDVKPYLGGGAFKELMNESYFCMVRPAHHGIAWPHEQDFSADTIIWDIENAQSGSRRFLTSSPHTTLHAAPHRAVHQP